MKIDAVKIENDRIKFTIKNKKFEYSYKTKYFIMEIETLQDMEFDCNRYKDEMVKQLHLHNLFSMIHEEIRPYTVFNKDEFIEYCDKILKSNGSVICEVIGVINDYFVR